MADKPISWRVREALDLGLPCVATLRPGTKLLLSFLASCADPDGGGIKRSVSTLSRITGLKPRTMKRRLEELRKAGVLVYESPGGGRAPAVRRIVLSGVVPDTAGVSRLTPQQCQSGHRSSVSSGTAGVSPAAPKVDHEVDLEGNREDGSSTTARADGWPASPAMDTTPRGPNAPPTTRQLAAIRSFRDELEMPASPEPRTRGEASRIISDLKIETIKRRALRESTAREANRRQGLVDGKHEQAADAAGKLADFIRKDEHDRRRRGPVR